MFKATQTGSTLNSCVAFTLQSINNSQVLQVTGSSIAVGTGAAWLGTSLTGVYINYSNGGGAPLGHVSGNIASATGNPPANGLSAQQPAAGAPVSLTFSTAGSLSGSPYGGGSAIRIDANYTLNGTAAAYSFA